MINNRLVSSQDLAAGLCLAAGTAGAAGCSGVGPARLTLAPGARWHARKENTCACAMTVCLGVLLLVSSIDAHKGDDLIGSVAMHEWSAREWSHITWSSDAADSSARPGDEPSFRTTAVRSERGTWPRWPNGCGGT